MAESRLVVTTEARFQRKPDGSIWHDTGGRGYAFWTRYLDVFDDVTVVARVFPVTSRVATAVEGPGVRVHALPPYAGATGLIRNLRAVERSVQEACRDPDSAVIARLPGPIGSVTVRYLRRCRRTYSLEVVGDPYDVLARGAVHVPFRALARRCSYLQLRHFAKHATACAYVTQAALQRRYPPGPQTISAAFPGVDLSPDAFAEGPLLRYPREPSGPFRLVSVGVLSPYKGHEVLLAALASLIAANQLVTLTIVGAGPLREALGDWAKAFGIADAVDFVGQQPSGEGVRGHLDRSDLFVLPSLTEGLPRALLEAMARGLPCIASNVGGVGELLDAEDLVPAGDAAALTDSLLAAMTDHPRLAQMARRNFTHAQTFQEATTVRKRNEFLDLVARAVPSTHFSSTQLSGGSSS